MKVDELTTADYNPRYIEEQNLRGLRKSIDEFGLVQPIVYNKKTKTCAVLSNEHWKDRQQR